MHPSSSPQCEASTAGPLPAGGLHRRGLSAGGRGAEDHPRLTQDHRRAAGCSSRVPAPLAPAHLFSSEAEQGHNQTIH
ncbi:hypothetical protein NL108_014934, partial [Boleophthalmus pectinirostris]